MEKESFNARFRKALDIRNMRQVDLANKTRIPKTSINQYVTGYASNPTTERVYLLAQALKVDPVWLMGFDVPMEQKEGKVFDETYLAEQIKNNPKIFEVVNYFTRLTKTNQELVLNLCRSLVPIEDQQ